jgi:hypothetical protein
LSSNSEITTVTFVAARLSVELEVHPDHHGAGTISPPLATAVELERAIPLLDGVVTVHSDDDGRFDLQLGDGLCRLRIGSGPEAVVTSWFHC